MNYDVKMKSIIESIPNGKVPKILLHSCCAPCSSHALSVLTQYFDVTILYYNPNIEPFLEYEKRKEEQKSFIKRFKGINKIDIIDCDYDNDSYREMVKGLEDELEGGPRCFKCYDLRMRKTAQMAKELGFENMSSFSTDDFKGGKAAMEYLLLRGHRKTGIVGGSMDSSFGQISISRLDGAIEVLKSQGIEFDFDKQYEPSRFSKSNSISGRLVMIFS